MVHRTLCNSDKNKSYGVKLFLICEFGAGMSVRYSYDSMYEIYPIHFRVVRYKTDLSKCSPIGFAVRACLLSKLY